MIVLRYPEVNTQTEDWSETLKGMALAHKLELDEQLEGPQLSHSGQNYTGAKEITGYLDQLYAEREEWWYCTCDRKPASESK
jgi:hypothetical protein